MIRRIQFSFARNRRKERGKGKYGVDRRIVEGCACRKLRNRTSIRGREVQDDGWRAGSDTGTGTHYSR